MLTDEQH